MLLLEVLLQEELNQLGELVSEDSESIGQFKLVVAGPDVLVVFTQKDENLQDHIDHQQRLLGEKLLEVPQVEGVLQGFEPGLADDGLVLQELVDLDGYEVELL